jgi:hypothetical protein
MCVPLISHAGLARHYPQPGQTAAVGLLAAACVAWSALPLRATGPGTAVLVVASGCAVPAPGPACSGRSCRWSPPGSACW